jgi:hypothetical protein
MTQKSKWWRVITRKKAKPFQTEQPLAPEPSNYETQAVKQASQSSYCYSDFIVYFKYPFLICINTGQVHRLKIGRTLVGASIASADGIRIDAIDIDAEHCFFDTTTDNGQCVVIMHPKAELCSVDGVLIDSAFQLKLGLLFLLLSI